MNSIMLNFLRACALVLGVFGLLALIAGFATHTSHNIVIGVVMEILMIACVQADKIDRQ